jgi:3-oxoacyl-[acyl-carrier-protein] synthase-3
MRPMSVGISAIAYHLPESILDNEDLAAGHARFQPEKIRAKTGIRRRHIAGPGECASDLAVGAAEKLLAETGLARDGIDYLIFCTQAPDHFLPTTACLIHRRLGLAPKAGAVDINLGCSGFVYGLGLAAGLILSGQATRVLLLTADTYSKFIPKGDLGLASIFGDAGAAALIEADAAKSLGSFVYGSDGTGARHLIVPSGGLRRPATPEDGHYTTHAGETRTGLPLFMNGPEVFNFTLAAVPGLVRDTLAKAALGMEDIDLFVFHQANATMLEALRLKLAIPPEKFWCRLEETGNTVSSTIPIALRQALDEGSLRSGMQVMLVGFGIGYSWAACIARF